MAEFEKTLSAMNELIKQINSDLQDCINAIKGE